MHLARTLRQLVPSWFGRRAHPRIPTKVPVDFRVSGSGVNHRSETEDLSRGGAMVGALEPLLPGSPLIVTVATGLGPRELHARVVWSGPTRMGVRFGQPFMG